MARNLLAGNQPVRAVVRDLRKGEAWAQLGCDLVRADINDAGALTSAFKRGRKRVRARSAELRSVARLSRGAGDGRHVEIGARGSASGQSRISVHDRHTGDSIEPAYAAHHYRASAWRVVDADYLSAARMVHGEL